MLINIGWLKDWVAVAGSADSLGEDLTRAGLEVEAITSLRPDFSGVVVAEIRGVGRHPQADRLTLCVVDDGRGLKNVVCGAPNAAAGMRAPYARVGARLPGGKSIAATEIRGTTSQGMLCSAHELGLGEQGAGLLALDADAPLGTSLDEHLGLDDAVLDVKITPNRGDCLSALGIAREIAAKSPVAVRHIKRAFNTIEHMPVREAYRYEQSVTVELSHTEDAREAQRAFVEKRKPVFKGK